MKNRLNNSAIKANSLIIILLYNGNLYTQFINGRHQHPPFPLRPSRRPSLGLDESTTVSCPGTSKANWTTMRPSQSICILVADKYGQNSSAAAAGSLHSTVINVMLYLTAGVRSPHLISSPLSMSAAFLSNNENYSSTKFVHTIISGILSL